MTILTLSFCVLWCPADGWPWIQRSNALEHCFRMLTALPLPIAPTRSNKPSKHWALKKKRRDSDGTQRQHVHHYFRPGHRRRTSFHGCSLRHHVAMLTGVKLAVEAGANAVVATHLYGLTIPENRKSLRSSQTKAFFCWKIAHKPRTLPLLANARGPSVTPSALAFTRPKTTAPWATVALSSPTRLPLRSRLRNCTSTAGHRSIAWKWPAPETAAWAKCKSSSTPSSCRIWTKVMRDTIRSPSVIARKSSKPTLFIRMATAMGPAARATNADAPPTIDACNSHLGYYSLILRHETEPLGRRRGFIPDMDEGFQHDDGSHENNLVNVRAAAVLKFPIRRAH